MSDLHLGEPDHNRCTSSASDVLALLDVLEGMCDEVIVVGDAFDLMRPRRPRGWRPMLHALRDAHGDLVTRLEACARVVGNHDRPLVAHGVPEELTYVTRDERVLVMHGHQWDVWLKRVWGLEESANFVAGWLERKGLDGVSTWMGDVPGRVQAMQQRGDIAGSQDLEHAYWKGVERELERGFDVLVSGHTHGLELREMPGGKLGINTGSHVHGHRDAAALDTDQGWAMTWRDGEVREVARREASGWRVAQANSADFKEVCARWGAR